MRFLTIELKEFNIDEQIRFNLIGDKVGHLVSQNSHKSLTEEFLFGWYYCLYPRGDGVEMIKWFLQCLKNALLETEQSMRKILNKATFWKIHETTPINERQRFILNKLLNDFEGKLKTSKWTKMTK